MIKSDPAAVERELHSRLREFKDRATGLKDAHRASKKTISEDVRASDIGKRERIAELEADTKKKLDGIKAEQATYISGLRDRLEREVRGAQPTDANSVLLRRDAADRARKVTTQREALDLLADAEHNGDTTLADAVGHRARQAAWSDAVEAYHHARPGTAGSASALAYVEEYTSGPAFNVANSMTYSPSTV